MLCRSALNQKSETSEMSGDKGIRASNGCCDMRLKCWCRWHPTFDHSFLISSAFSFFLISSLLFGSLALAFAWLTFSPYERPRLSSYGCQDDNEGSWSIGVYYGDNPFSLKPLELRNVWSDKGLAWPVANPVMTCALASDAGYPSNFVADPFLYVQDDILYMFFETKNSVTLKGEIGVARSLDNSATWEHLGIALDEEWHLSFPYVFSYNGEIYMLPEGSQKGDLRLYRALKFPLQWTLEKVILKRPMVDSFIIQRDRSFWLFGSDISGFSTKKNGELEIWYSKSLLGPWKSHKGNPIYNTLCSRGARNAGRPFIYEGQLYRMGQDCGETYGHRVRLFRVEVLTKEAYKEVEVPFRIEEPQKARNAWNGARYHHLDIQRLPSGHWIAVMDGDRVWSGDTTRRLISGLASAAVVVILLVLTGILVGAIKCVLPLSWCLSPSKKTSHMGPRLLRLFTRLNRSATLIRGRVKPNTCSGILILCLLLLLGIACMCMAVRYLYGGNGAEEAYMLNGAYSQFTMVTMTYEARIWNLKMYVKHYSRCASVGEIVVVWNKGHPPDPSEFDSAVPVRVRVEERNSLNNRFKLDPLIKTRAVLELDDDIMMTCDDIERGFRVWREHPERIVGFYPRLIDGSPLKYRDEKYARMRKGYNMILTGAAFMDGRLTFERYWSERARKGREVVDKYFNCEDVLLNFLFANASSGQQVVEYVRPAWAIDTSKLSGAAISKDTRAHYRIRTDCLLKFSEMYGSLVNHRWNFDGRKDGWDV
ncbi:glycosyltransferase family protein 64 protein C5 [Amborella trichopoda]|uniref:Glucosamine inositolphosphorylceramide transferase 1 n=1 Tax=Amborella trichopoda TaxID=13333 RepID=W1NUJ8_AMBTC|nr:glycosyltransferase family protein 64 protein C5 [Amborella trichopoda]ERN01297.1 hypothetical protein AMTR_s00002p00253220 [Amborella trichopoda]|eukprot:XP_006838728.1 glycosyltransferase family protein 64 protein C5 [Amborella trichopoda]